MRHNPDKVIADLELLRDDALDDGLPTSAMWLTCAIETIRDLEAATADDDCTREGCDCTELCSMGPTCPGGMLARLPGSGCWRTATADTGLRNVLAEHFWHPPVPNPKHAMHLGGCYCGWQCRLAFGESRIDQYVDHLHAAILDATAAPTTDTGARDE